MSKSKIQDVPENFAKLRAAASRFADGARLLRFNDNRSVEVSRSAASFERYVDCFVESMVRQSTDPAALEKFDHAIAPAVEKLGDLAACFHEDAALGRATLPRMNDFEIGLFVGAMDTDRLTRLMHMLVAYPTPRQTPERTALIDGLVAASVPVEMIGLPQPAIIKILLIVVLKWLADASPWQADLVDSLLTELTALDEAAGKPHYVCPPKGDGDGGKYKGDDGKPGGGDDGKPKGGGDSPPKKPNCGDVRPYRGVGSGFDQDEAKLACYKDAEGNAKDACPAECEPRFVDKVSDEKFSPPAPDGKITCRGEYRFSCG